MAELATLARPYAKAVFELAKSQRALDHWSRMLTFLHALTENAKIQDLLDSPDLADEQKARRLNEISGDALDDRGRKFVLVLARNKRLPLIGEIRDQFEELKAQEEKVLDVEVVSAFELSQEQSDTLRDALQRKYQREVSLTSRVDRQLLGGALIRAGDTVIDGSVRGRLDKLAETLQRN